MRCPAERVGNFEKLQLLRALGPAFTAGAFLQQAPADADAVAGGLNQSRVRVANENSGFETEFDNKA